MVLPCNYAQLFQHAKISLHTILLHSIKERKEGTVGQSYSGSITNSVGTSKEGSGDSSENHYPLKTL
jgi:hypothetical protein